METSIILPTYNEKGNISKLIKKICDTLDSEKTGFEIVVIDDNSPDGTAELVKEKFGEDHRIKVFVRYKERGLATAIRYGIEKSVGDNVVVMDTDFNHDPQMLPQLIEFLKYYDVVIGSRFVLGGGMEDTMRYYFSAIYTIWLRFFLGIHIKDKLSGFFSIKKENLASMDMESIFTGYGDFFIRLLLNAQKKGYRMLEVPTFYQLRKAGHSKTNFIKVFLKYTKASIRIFFSRERWRKNN
ncbi:MAG: glycosyltransferase [Promethearchaeota archaeon]|jgi:dolichol-phosphate mannosyltransferase